MLQDIIATRDNISKKEIVKMLLNEGFIERFYNRTVKDIKRDFVFFNEQYLVVLQFYRKFFVFRSTLKYICFYSRGEYVNQEKRDGVSVCYHKNGFRKVVSYWNNNKRVGSVQHFDNKGKPSKIKMF